MSSSPSTRFDGSDIDGLKEDDLEIPKKFLQVMYAHQPLYGCSCERLGLGVQHGTNDRPGCCSCMLVQ